MSCALPVPPPSIPFPSPFAHRLTTQSELANLKAFLKHDPSKPGKEQIDERLALKAASEERVKNWPNLIETIRLKKEKDRQERMNRDEGHRRVLDKEEAEYQAQIRSEAINKANQMLYKQDDRVKTFTSKLFLSHVLDERAKQIEITRQKQELVKQREAEWALIQQEQVRVADEKEEVRQRSRRESSLKLKEQQREQLQEVRVRKISEIEEAQAEGRQIREAAESAIEKDREVEEARRQKAIEINKQYLEDNRRSRVIREQKAHEEEAEMKKIKTFALLKEQQMLERKRRAEEKFNADLSRRQEMIARQAAHLEAIASEAEDRVLTQMRDAEREKEAKAEVGRIKREKQWSQIEASRKRQVTLKEKHKALEASEKKRVTHIQQQQQARLVDEEVELRDEARRRNEELLAFQKRQINEKLEKKQAERESELLEGKHIKEALEHEENMFQDYVASVMDRQPYVKGSTPPSSRRASSGGGKTPSPPQSQA